jgi:glucan biosynthesis protein
MNLSRMEVNDNIVAFWRPRKTQGRVQDRLSLNWQEWRRCPREHDGHFPAAAQCHQIAVVSSISPAQFSGDILLTCPLPAARFNIALQLPQVGGMRLTFEFDPEGMELVEFRALSSARRADQRDMVVPVHKVPAIRQALLPRNPLAMPAQR